MARGTARHAWAGQRGVGAAGVPSGVAGAAASAWGCAILTALLAWPVVEVFAVVEIGKRAGSLATAALLLGGSGLGVLVLRSGGLRLAANLLGWGRAVAERGEVAVLPVASSVPRLCAGVLLLLPGFASDALGVLCLLPPLRWALVRRVERLFLARQAATEAAMRARAFGGAGGAAGTASAAAGAGGPGAVIIEGVVIRSGPAGEPDGAAAGDGLEGPNPLLPDGSSL